MNKKLKLSNCSQCGKVFIRKNKDICPSCNGLDYKILEIIVLYLDQHPTATLNDLVDETGMPEESVERLLKEGKLASYQNLILSCRLCGKPVKASSRKMICHHCFVELSNNQSSEKKIVNLRNTIIRRDISNVEHKIRERSIERAKKKKYGFRASTKDSTFKQTSAKEVESLPEIEKTYKLKTGNKFQPSLSVLFI